ncbi:hypothetical protein MMC07_007193 [Pseudocyphellaria aurata]|nr:hypothetical protein [Pseudocyphellaria aurata]
MATDNKKKRGMFAKISRSSDDKSKPSSGEPSNNTPLEKFKLAMKTPWNRTTNDIHELNASHVQQTSISSEPGARIRASSVSTTPSKFVRLQSSLTLAEVVHLPALPGSQIFDQSHVGQHHSPVARKTKSYLHLNRDRERVRPVISAPVLVGPGPKMRTRPIIPASTGQEPSPAEPGMLLDEDAAEPHDIATPQMSTARAEEINRQADELMEKMQGWQAVDAATDMDYPQDKGIPQGVERVSTEKTVRLSPLQRGKAVLMRATRAISFRRNSSKSNGLVGQALLDNEDGTPLGSSPYDASTSSKSNVNVNSPNTNSPTLVARHHAMSHNLVNVKIQDTLGDGLIKRKPLPSKVIPRPLSPEYDDPDEDARVDALLASTMPNFSGFRFDFEATGAPLNDSGDEDSFQRGSESPADFVAEDCHVESESRSTRHGFSYLEDMAEIDDFSSSPAEPSTPLTGPSSAFAFSTVVSGLAQHPDVMSFATPPVDGENAGTVCSICQSWTEDRQALLLKDRNTAIAPRDKDRVDSKGVPRSGLESDTDKGKEPMMSEEVEEPPLPQRRAASYTRPAIPRPFAGFYGSEFRAHGPFDTKIDK